MQKTPPEARPLEAYAIRLPLPEVQVAKGMRRFKNWAIECSMLTGQPLDPISCSKSRYVIDNEIPVYYASWEASMFQC